MKVSLNWLRDYIEYDASPAALADLLTMAGIEVEGVLQRGVHLDQVVVAQITSSEQHPNADRLSVCRVDDGSGQPRQIVCGAKNFQAGDKVPLALPGATLPGDFKIKVGKLRGVESEGMLCSGKELGVADDADGLLILPKDARVGAPIGEMFPSDTVFDLEITPNRPDLLSYVGLAREIAALSKGQLYWPGDAEWQMLAVAPRTDDNELSVTIAPDAADACPYYSARLIRGVTVGPSPDWLRTRLEAAGLRSINNVVDITNYVLLETGQPLHAFDAAKIPGSALEPRLAHDGEEFLALDGKTYRLQPHQLVIAAQDGPALALAGVMGGAGSGVTAATRDVVLESAYFASAGIRRTSRETGISSDSSYRFERGVDPGATADASLRATQLILRAAGGEAGATYVRETSSFAGQARGERLVTINAVRCQRLLGQPVSSERIAEILSGFGLQQVANNAGIWRVPSYRGDLTREVDLIEEISRVIGLHQTPSRTRAAFAAVSPVDHEYDFAMTLRRRLAGLGFFEARSVSLLSEAAAQGSGGVRLKNPLNEEGAVLRGSLLPGLLAAAGRNARLGATDLRLFEIGRVFSPEAPAGVPEPSRLAVLFTGAALAPGWRNSAAREADFHDLRGVFEALAPGLEVAVAPADALLAQAVTLSLGGEPLGRAGQLMPARARELDLRGAAFVAEIDVAALRRRVGGERRFAALARFPSVTRDLAIVADAELPHGRIAGALRGAGEPLLTGIELFDVFTDAKGEKVPAGKKSLAYSLTFRADDRTLKTEEVNAAHARLKTALQAAAPDLRFRE